MGVVHILYIWLQTSSFTLQGSLLKYIKSLSVAIVVLFTLLLTIGDLQPAYAGGDFKNRIGKMKVVKATWYAKRFHGRIMKNGEPFDNNDLTIVAHKKFPIGTKLLIEAPNGKSLVVEVQDRGPFNKNPEVVLDFPVRTAVLFGFKDAGIGTLKMTVLQLG